MTLMLANDVNDLPITSLTMHSGPVDPRRNASTPTMYRVRSIGDVRHFGALVFDSRRRRPLVTFVIDPRRVTLADPGTVASELFGDADVVVIDAAVMHNGGFDDQIAQWLRPNTDAVRLYRPGADVSDDRSHHPAIELEPRGVPYNTEKVSRAVRAMLAMLEINARAGSGADSELQAEKTRREKLQTRVTTVETNRRELRAELAAATAALDELRRPVFADPEIQFRHDLWLTWLRSTEEGDRQRWPLRDWDLGPGFLASIDRQQIVDRDRVLRACVDVVSGRHAEIPSRASHRLRNGKAGQNDHQRTRDNAYAWSCAINMGPAAARLRWWERPDRIVELSLVTDHDDVRLSE